MSTPSTNITVMSGVRLNHDYQHTIMFATASDQWAYFAGKGVRTFEAYSYIRRSWTLKVAATMSEAQTWNYMMFPRDGKVFYYFINKIEYINDSTVELFVEMDVMQTYMFNPNGSAGYTLLPCFVEREHSATDVIGVNLVDEGLDVGEYMTISDEQVDLNDWKILILASANIVTAAAGGELVPVYARKFSGVFSGLSVYLVDANDYGQLGTLLNQLDEHGATETIVAMWMYPGELLNWADVSGSTFVKECGQPKAIYHETARNSQLFGGYTPKNNKLYCYPYNFLYASDNNGGAAVYPYEFFGDPSACNFKVVGSVSSEGGVRMYPLNYKGTQHAYDEGLTLKNYPTCAWDSDVYKLWLAQNQNQQNQAFALGGVKIAGGAFAAIAPQLGAAGVAKLLGGAAAAVGAPGLGAVAGASMIVSGLSDITSILAQRADKEVQPPQARGTFSASVNMTAGFQTFNLKKKSIDRYHAIMIDNFFSMYGYKCGIVKVPHRNVRENWTYTKTIGCKISGKFGADDQTKIESIYNNGITFWANGDSVGDYSLTNGCTMIAGGE